LLLRSSLKNVLKSVRDMYVLIKINLYF